MRAAPDARQGAKMFLSMTLPLQSSIASQCIAAAGPLKPACLSKKSHIGQVLPHTVYTGAEVPVTSETQDDEPGLSPQASNADAYDARSAFSSPAQSPGSEISNAAVPLAVIKKQLVLEEISRSGEMGGITYESVLPPP